MARVSMSWLESASSQSSGRLGKASCILMCWSKDRTDERSTSLTPWKAAPFTGAETAGSVHACL